MQEMTLAATVDNIKVVTAFVNAELEKLNCRRKIVNQIDIAIDELFGNIVRYGYNSGGGDVTVRLERAKSPEGVIITFIDRGIPFNPLNAKVPDITLSPRKRPIGGLGVYMVKESMDGIDYVHENGCNRLSIRKNL